MIEEHRLFVLLGLARSQRDLHAGELLQQRVSGTGPCNSVQRRIDQQVTSLAGNQLFLSASTVAELRYGAVLAGWGEPRRARLERAIETTTVIPVSEDEPA